MITYHQEQEKQHTCHYISFLSNQNTQKSKLDLLAKVITTVVIILRLEPVNTIYHK